MARRTPPSETNDVVVRDMLRGFVGEIEASDDRIASENRHKSAIYKRAKDKGFNVKALRKVIAARRMDEVDRNKLEGDFDLYWITVADLAHAHVENIEEFGSDDEPDHDPETGEIIEGEVGKEFPASELRRDEGEGTVAPGSLANPIQPSESTATPTQPQGDSGNVSADALAQSGSAGGENVDASSKTGEANAASPVPAPNSQTREGMPGERPGVAGEPAGEAIGSTPASPVASRPDGCLNPSVCASSSWRKLCHSCSKASLAPVGLTIGAADIPHEGQIH